MDWWTVHGEPYLWSNWDWLQQPHDPAYYQSSFVKWIGLYNDDNGKLKDKTMD